MLALAQCWFSRTHVPEGRGHREADGSLTSRCRHCERPVIRREGQGHWRLAEGIDLDQLAEAAPNRFLYLLDSSDDFIIARFPVQQMAAEEIDAYKAELRQQHGVDLPGSLLILKDSTDKS